MAYVEDPLKKKQEEDAQAPQAGTAPAGGAAAPLAAQAGAAPVPALPAQRSPSNFVNFQSYFNANKAGAEASSNKLAGDVEKQARAAQTGLAGAQEQFGKAVDAGSPLGSSRPKSAAEQYMENAGAAGTRVAAPQSTPGQRYAEYFNPGPRVAVEPAAPTSDITGRPQLSQPGSKAAAGPPPAVGNVRRSGLDIDPLAGTKPDEASGAYVNTPGITREEAQRRAGLSYTGPGSITEQAGFGDVAGRVTGAADRARGLGSGAGVRGALEQENAGRGYSSGQGRLDAALLGQAGAPSFQALRNQFGGMGNSVVDAISQSQRDSARARFDTAQAAKRYAELAKPEATTNMSINKPFNPSAPTSNRIVAVEDPNGLSAQIAKYGPSILASFLPGPAGAVLNAGMAVSQADADKKAEEIDEESEEYRRRSSNG